MTWRAISARLSPACCRPPRPCHPPRRSRQSLLHLQSDSVSAVMTAAESGRRWKWHLHSVDGTETNCFSAPDPATQGLEWRTLPWAPTGLPEGTDGYCSPRHRHSFEPCLLSKVPSDDVVSPSQYPSVPTYPGRLGALALYSGLVQSDIARHIIGCLPVENGSRMPPR
jgi:hypothetical protein